MQGKIAKKRDKRSETMDEIATQYMKARTDSINKGTEKAEEEKEERQDHGPVQPVQVPG
jgi:hypothetical protein